MTSNDCAWTLHGGIGELRVGGLSGRVDVAHPELGLHDIVMSAGNPGGRMFCVSRLEGASDELLPGEDGTAWPLAVADAYVRGDDLVARYEPAADWPYSPQIYWRANAIESFDGLASSLSLLVSVQTHLLDTWPRIGVDSRLACGETLHVVAREGKRTLAESLGRDSTIRDSGESCCILRRLANVPLSYVEIMPASDFQEVRIRDDGTGNRHVVWDLFSEFLEKGVIRRARLHGALVRRENDVELAAACCQMMERCALPLTT